MKNKYAVLLLGAASLIVFNTQAADQSSPIPLFPDAPPPPPIADTLPRYCCTSAGRLGPIANLDPCTGKPVQEGESCEAIALNGYVEAGKACY